MSEQHETTSAGMQHAVLHLAVNIVSSNMEENILFQEMLAL